MGLGGLVGLCCGVPVWDFAPPTQTLGGVQGVMWGGFAEAGVPGRCQFSEFNKLLEVELLCCGQGSVLVCPAEA